MAKKNSNLTAAKKAKNDEFYTRIEDIEHELYHYKDFFKGKKIYCNCDDFKESNFTRYFLMNFIEYELEQLICTHYEIEEKSIAFKITKESIQKYLTDGRLVIVGNTEEEALAFLNKIIDENIFPLEANGDFRSPEAIKFLEESDIVVTNPPFSLFREFVAQLVELDKQFVIVGNKNAITYKEIFPLIKDNKLWLGYGSPREFTQPDGSTKKEMSGLTRWFTNLPIKKRYEKLDFIRKYKNHEENYPKYDNYDAINVDKVVDIPEDYFGVMGVPITFLDKYNPEQFEIVSFRKGEDGKDLVFTRERERVQPYFRILVQRVLQE